EDWRCKRQSQEQSNDKSFHVCIAHRIYPLRMPTRRRESYLPSRAQGLLASVATSASIWATIAFIRHPVGTSLAPCRRMRANSSLDSKSINITAASFTTTGREGFSVINACQHFSNSVEAGAVSFPSTVKLVASLSSCTPILSIIARPFTVTSAKLSECDRNLVANPSEMKKSNFKSGKCGK